jgi:hypothetical protein
VTPSEPPELALGVHDAGQEDQLHLPPGRERQARIDRERAAAAVVVELEGIEGPVTGQRGARVAQQHAPGEALFVHVRAELHQEAGVRRHPGLAVGGEREHDHGNRARALGWRWGRRRLHGARRSLTQRHLERADVDDAAPRGGSAENLDPPVGVALERTVQAEALAAGLPAGHPRGEGLVLDDPVPALEP